MSSLKRALALPDVGSAKKPSRGGSVFSLRWLMFADGDQNSVGKRSPSFAEVFASVFANVDTGRGGEWVESDLPAYCKLCLMTLFWFKHMFIGSADADEDDDDEDDDSCASSSATTGDVPQLLQPKLYDIVNQVNNVFNIVDGPIAEEIAQQCQFADAAKAKFRYSFRQVLQGGVSKKIAAECIPAAMRTYAVVGNGFAIGGEPMTEQLVTEYFNDSPAIKSMIASRSTTENALRRADSLHAHAVGTHSEVKQLKTCLFTLAQMIVHLEQKIDALTPSAAGDSQSSTTSALGALMISMREATDEVEVAADAAAAVVAASLGAPAASAVGGGASGDGDDDGGARAMVS